MSDAPLAPRAAWSVPEFCDRYRISIGQAFLLMRQGKVQRVKIGRRTVIPVESADAWWQSLSLPKAG